MKIAPFNISLVFQKANQLKRIALKEKVIFHFIITKGFHIILTKWFHIILTKWLICELIRRLVDFGRALEVIKNHGYLFFRKCVHQATGGATVVVLLLDDLQQRELELELEHLALHSLQGQRPQLLEVQDLVGQPT